MNFDLDERTLSRLFPFSFLTDGKGVIVDAGRSLRRRCPWVRPGIHYTEVFEVIRPVLNASAKETPHPGPEIFGEELILLRGRDHPEFGLRGQVVALEGAGRTFLYSVNPGVMDLDEMKALGIGFEDFPPGDPLFDFVMLYQSQKAAQVRLETALARMDLENRLSRILYQITRKTAEAGELEEACLEALRGVCDGLGWNLGLLHRVHSHGGERVAHYSRDGQAPPDSREWVFGAGAGGAAAAGAAAVEKRVIWKTERPEGVSRVAVPVLAEGEVVAVLEYFTTQGIQTIDSLVRLFDSLGILMGSVVARQSSHRREKEHLASLVTASKMASLGEIAAGVAHEINNPLASISIVGQTLARIAEEKVNGKAIDPAVLSKQVLRISSCVQRIMGIVRGLSDFSRDSSEDPYQPCSLARILEETLDLCHARFFHFGVELRVSAVPRDLQIQCRASQILQVLLNLLNNAFDAVQGLDEQWVELEFRIEDPWVELSITDSGPGIPSEVARNMMKPFFTTKAAGKGTGLGLSISSRIIAEHGGSLRLDEGSAHTRFLVRVPKTPNHA
jgi:signal transduction histidine kinase